MKSVGTWCTVTTTDGEGKRYSLDMNADSSYDAAHLYVTHVHGNPSMETLFEVTVNANVHHVPGCTPQE